MSEQVTIYGLVCPIENKVMYVGKSIDVKMRFQQHIHGGTHDSTAKGKWIRELKSANLLPSLQIIETCDESVWVERETYWIKHHQSINPNLKNGHLHKSLKFYTNTRVSVRAKEPARQIAQPGSITLQIDKIATRLDINKSQLQRGTGLTMGMVRRYWDNQTDAVSRKALSDMLELFQKKDPSITIADLFTVDSQP